MRAQGKAFAMHMVLLSPEIDEELVQWLQEEEVVAEGAWLGRDAATLEVVMEAAGLLMGGQV